MKLALALTVLRYLFLFLLYLFLFTVVRLMFRGLAEGSSPITAARKEQRRTDKTFYTGPEQARIAAPVPRLVVLAGSDPTLEKGEIFYLGERTTLGRGKNNSIVISDSTASQEHAVIFSRSGQYWVQDLNSKNGTYLNDMPIKKPTVLVHGDRLRIGGAIFRFLRWADGRDNEF